MKIEGNGFVKNIHYSSQLLGKNKLDGSENFVQLREAKVFQFHTWETSDKEESKKIKLTRLPVGVCEGDGGMSSKGSCLMALTVEGIGGGGTGGRLVDAGGTAKPFFCSCSSNSC